MTDVDYTKLKDTIDKIISNTSLLVEGINLKELTIIKKKLDTIKGIINDISKINECCGKGGVDPMTMLMIINAMKAGGSEEDIVEKLQEYVKNKE